MKRFSIVLYSLCLLLAVGCDSRSETDTYELTLSTPEGDVANRGTLQLFFSDASTDGVQDVTGSWRFSGADPSGTSSGSVSGEQVGANIFLLLDMNASDSGIELGGTSDEDRIAGTWNMITIAGPMPGGTFEAIRD